MRNVVIYYYDNNNNNTNNTNDTICRGKVSFSGKRVFLAFCLHKQTSEWATTSALHVNGASERKCAIRAIALCRLI